jgi:hypothetical protein
MEGFLASYSSDSDDGRTPGSAAAAPAAVPSGSAASRPAAAASRQIGPTIIEVRLRVHSAPPRMWSDLPLQVTVQKRRRVTDAPPLPDQLVDAPVAARPPLASAAVGASPCLSSSAPASSAAGPAEAAAVDACDAAAKEASEWPGVARQLQKLQEGAVLDLLLHDTQVTRHTPNSPA